MSSLPSQSTQDTVSSSSTIIAPQRRFKTTQSQLFSKYLRSKFGKKRLTPKNPTAPPRRTTNAGYAFKHVPSPLSSVISDLLPNEVTPFYSPADSSTNRNVHLLTPLSDAVDHRSTSDLPSDTCRQRSHHPITFTTHPVNPYFTGDTRGSNSLLYRSNSSRANSYYFLADFNFFDKVHRAMTFIWRADRSVSCLVD
jgi:hypothetical protein